MTQDSEIVQQVVVPEGTPAPAVVTPPEPSPEEKMAKLVAEAVAQATELAKREIQSTKDKAMREVQDAQRRARLAEGALSSTRQRLQAQDPETAREMELAELRAKEQNRLTMEQEEQVAQNQAVVVQTFHNQMTQFISGLGISPTDPRIDWAGDAPDLLTMQRRILDSVSTVQKGNVKASEASLDAKIKEAEKRIRKDLGVEDANSVSTQMSGGTSSDGIPTDIVSFRKWIAEIPQAEYEKRAAKIDEMMRDGKIK